MLRRDPLACPRCGEDESEPGELGTALCRACGLEFRPRVRVPLRSATHDQLEAGERWTGFVAIALAAGIVGGVIASSGPPEPPPEYPTPRTLVDVPYDVEIPIFDPGPSPMAGPPLEAIEHRHEVREGRVRVTGLIAVPSRPASHPRVALAFLGDEGVELGRVQAEVACERIAELPCPFAFAGLAPPGTLDVSLEVVGDADWLGDLDSRTRLRFGFDEQGEPTTAEFEGAGVTASPPLGSTSLDQIDRDETHATLELHEDHVEVAVALVGPPGLRDVRATLVGYREASEVAFVLPLASPLGLTRRVPLPDDADPSSVVRWQLWLGGRP